MMGNGRRCLRGGRLGPGAITPALIAKLFQALQPVGILMYVIADVEQDQHHVRARDLQLVASTPYIQHELRVLFLSEPLCTLEGSAPS